MKANDLIVISRPWIEERIKFCNDYIKKNELQKHDENYIKLSEEEATLSFILHLKSKPLTPILSNVWDKGASWGIDNATKEAKKAKAQFLKLADL